MLHGAALHALPNATVPDMQDLGTNLGLPINAFGFGNLLLAAVHFGLVQVSMTAIEALIDCRNGGQ